MDTQGGYGSWPVAQMDKLVNGQPGVTAWSTFAFTQVPIDNQEVPVLGLTRHLGSVQPPTTSGHPISGPLQIELGTVTLRQLGKHVGDTVTAGTGRTGRTLTIVGTVTLPSMGLSLADHVSLGRGAMLADSTLLAIEGLSSKLTKRGDHSRTRYPTPPSPRRSPSTWPPAPTPPRWRRGSPTPARAIPRAAPIRSPGCWAPRS